MDGLWQSQEAVGSEDKALEGVTVTESFWNTLQLVPSSHKMLQARQLPDGSWDPLEVQTIIF